MKSNKTGKGFREGRAIWIIRQKGNMHQVQQDRGIPNLSKTFSIFLAFRRRYGQIPHDFKQCMKRFMPMVKNIDRFHPSQNLVTHHTEI